jgi:hypothetical protein
MPGKPELPAIDAKFLRRLLTRTRNRARRAEIRFTLSDTYAEQQFAAQHGRCDVTGLKFHLERFPDALVKHPFAPSIDRKRSDRGYTSNNARLVCVGVNFGMGQWGQEVYMRLARAAVQHETEGKSEPAQSAADDWAAQQMDRIAGAEKILSLIVDPAEHAAQVHHIAALKAHLSRRLRRGESAT